MEWWQLAVYGVVVLIMAVFSGIAGGGGGFVTTPLLIFFGLTPAQAVTSGKIGGLSLSIGALSGMRSVSERLSKRRVIPIMILAFVVGLLVPFIIRAFDSDVYRIILGIILLLMVPVMIFKKIGIEPHEPTQLQKYGGSVLLTITLFLQGVFGGGLGSLVNVVLMGMLGMTSTEANVTKRWSQVILNITIVLGVLFSNLIVWSVVLVSVPITLVGGHIGGKIAVSKGNQFVINTMIVLMIVSSLLLIFGVDF